LPQIELSGNLSPLNLRATSGLVEMVHIVFFPNRIVGCEFNFYGPRLNRLEAYLLTKARQQCPAVSFKPLLRQDIRRQLDRLSDIRLLQLKIHAPYADMIAQANQNLGAAFRAARMAGDAAELEIILRPRSHSQGRLAMSLLDTVKRLAGRGDLREAASKFVIKGFDSTADHVSLVDVLSDQLISRKQIVIAGQRMRALDPSSAYAAIEEAYRELETELLSAASMH
jgi:hypothetical protein